MLTGSELGLKNEQPPETEERRDICPQIQNKGRKTTVAGAGRGREEVVEGCPRWKGRSSGRFKDESRFQRGAPSQPSSKALPTEATWQLRSGWECSVM